MEREYSFAKEHAEQVMPIIRVRQTYKMENHESLETKIMWRYFCMLNVNMYYVACVMREC